MNQLLSELNNIFISLHLISIATHNLLTMFFVTPYAPLLGNKESHKQNTAKNLSPTKSFPQYLRKCSTFHQVELYTPKLHMGIHDFSFSDGN